MPTRLITIPFSHDCEKALWALERAGVAYTEEERPAARRPPRGPGEATG